MTLTIILALCILLLLAYLFDLTSSRTKIPSVILLLALGWVVRQITYFWGIQLPDFSEVLPVLGTVGLILIVLEGSLELELDHSKYRLIGKSFVGALLAMLATAFLLACLFSWVGQFSFKDSLLNAIPLCVISSAVAIPSVRNLSASNKEFVIYESSLSDIFGVLFFNFIAFNDSFDRHSFGHFGSQLLLIFLVSFAATIGLAILLHKIEHHIKFVPIILLIILIYAISKIYHLPALIFILIFGLFIGNMDELKRFNWIKKLHPEELNTEVKKLKELTLEGAFLIRALFFLLFGYLVETSQILNSETFLWAIGIVLLILAIRIGQLKLSGLPLNPLVFIAPRGLITILLFLSIAPEQSISLVNKSLIIQVIVLLALVMMFGLMTVKNKEEGAVSLQPALVSPQHEPDEPEPSEPPGQD